MQLVVLTAAQRLLERGPLGDGDGIQGEADTGGVGQPVQVERQPVGHVDHGVRPAQPGHLPFGQPGHGPAIRRRQRLDRSDRSAPPPGTQHPQPGGRAAAGPGDEDGITGLPTGPLDRSAAVRACP